MVNVLRNERKAGSNGSKQKIFDYSTATIIEGKPILIDVESTWVDTTPYWSENALIENLIIDGQNYPNTTGIRLNNVVNCFIRNLTIRNCDIGIDLYNTEGKWTEFNRIEHVRLENVKTGIKFSTNGVHSSGWPGDSFGFTKIDDVGIALKNDSYAIGIQIGDGNSLKIKPYCSFIKANVWIDSAGGTGMQLDNAELRQGLINLTVEGPSIGRGVDLTGQTPGCINENQFSHMFLSCGGVTPIYPVNPLPPSTDIQYVSY